ncbi:MAG: chitobiase/beta-hexosaminidase C-terminal domain-containing protein [Armatimonadota bacterium]
MSHRLIYWFVLATMALLILANGIAFGAAFTDVDAGLVGDSAGCIAWGDYDNDGDLDLAVAGGKGTYIYKNENGDFIDIVAALPTVSWGAIAWADFDGDGDLDLALAGNNGTTTVTPIFRIYRNANGLFFDIDAKLPGIWNCALAWGDLDNDGDLDLAAAGDTDAIGAKPISTVFRNEFDGNSLFQRKFTDTNAKLFSVDGDPAKDYNGITRCSLDWADYDNDGDLDLLAAGELTNNYYNYHVTKLFKNTDGDLKDAQKAIPGVNACKVTWGDYNSDGLFDFAMAGALDGGASLSRVYMASGGSFNPMDTSGIWLPGVAWGSIAWGDYDNDGDLDLALAGNQNESGLSGLSKIFRNDAGTFVDIDAQLTPVAYASLGWGDLNNDGKLDIALAGHDIEHDVLFSKMYLNNTETANTPPTLPVPIGHLLEEDNGKQKVTLYWNPSTDDHTPPPGLTYNLQIIAQNANKERIYLMSAMINSDGKRQILAHGNAQKATQWTLKDINTDLFRYYWRVQAIDSAFAASTWPVVEEPTPIYAPVDDLVFTPDPDTYIDHVYVNIQSPTTVADIHYTLDGTDPDENSPLFSTDINLRKTTTIKARGYYGPDNKTPILEGKYTIQVGAPTFVPDPKPEDTSPQMVYDNEIDVVINAFAPDDTVHYTTDASVPTEESPIIASGGSIHLDKDTIVSARGFREGCEPSAVTSRLYLFKAATPAFNPDAGTFTSEQDVVVTCNTRNAVIHYTTNGLDPTESDPIVEHGKSVHVDRTLTLKAKAWYKTFAPSNVKTADYYLNLGPVFIPFFSPGQGTYITSVNVKITCETPGSIIRYTTDGSNPTKYSTLIESGDFVMIDKSLTLKARAWKGVYVPSDIRKAEYEIKVAAPIITPNAGSYAAGQTIRITCDTPGAVVHYTTDGNDPTENDLVMKADESIYINTNITVKAKAWKPGLTPSDISEAEYKIRLRKWLSMVSIPIIPDTTDPKEVVGFYGNGWYAYRTEARAYATYPDAYTWYDPVESAPGRGFWGCFDGKMIKPDGDVPPQDQPGIIRLYPGWNIIGLPFLNPVVWSQDTIKVRIPGQTAKPLKDSKTVITNYLWGWRQSLLNPSKGSYYLIGDETIPSRDTNIMVPWEGFWIKVKQECDLIIPPPTND